jgi:hypothetical protein
LARALGPLPSAALSEACFADGFICIFLYGGRLPRVHSSLRTPVKASEIRARMEDDGEGRAIRALTCSAEQFPELFALPIPARLAGDPTQLVFGDQTSMFRPKEQNVFLDLGGKLGENQDLGDARWRDVRLPRQFSIVFPLARMKQGFELVGERHQARHSRRPAYHFARRPGPKGGERSAAFGQSVFKGHDREPWRVRSSTDTVPAAPLYRSFSTVLVTNPFV